MTVKNPVGWFELYVRDIERARVFYEKVLSVSLTQLKQSGDSLCLGDCLRAVGRPAGFATAPPLLYWKPSVR
jgi:predicted enzyme related to lactoylglutathione lyase